MILHGIDSLEPTYSLDGMRFEGVTAYGIAPIGGKDEDSAIV